MTPKIEYALLRLFADCSKDLRIGQEHVLPADGMILCLSIRPLSEARPEPETLCESDTYDAARLLLNLHQRPVRAKEVLKELRLVEEPWSDSAVWKALATLCHKQLLENSHDGKGYRLGPNGTET